MIVAVTAEGARRLRVPLILWGSPLALAADIGPETVDAAIILGYIVAPAGWKRAFQ